MGWCDQQTTDKNCTGTRYQPGDKITLSRSNSDLTLYAIWHDNKMQNFDGCQYLPKNKQIELVDTRDNRMYYVAKLADDNCWMTENLDLFINENTTYTVADTDLNHATAEEKTACKDSEPSCVDESGNYQWKPRLKSSATTPSIYDPGDKCWTGERTWGTWTDHFASDSKDCNKHDASHYSLGNYYNYSAAVAQNDTSAYPEKNNHYNTSICPIGWQLPDINDKSFKSLQSAVAADSESPNWTAGYIGMKSEDQTEVNQESTIHNDPYYYTYGGYRAGSSSLCYGYGAWYLSSVVQTSTSLDYTLNIRGDGGISARSQGLRGDKLLVRCVARDVENQFYSRETQRIAQPSNL